MSEIHDLRSALDLREGARALSADGAVAFTVHDDHQQWESLTGLQGNGTCGRLTGTSRGAAADAHRGTMASSTQWRPPRS
ncbi:hypothetical protein ACN2WE_40005 [Streptomyces sp. cg28]|uniref:hypothetical protein n=1 Tax=Streptomyces sp. cg28 TaxID=3403457 RepID=UPI003B20BCD9